MQNGDKSLGKDPLTSDDSAVADLSPKTDSSPKTETPTKTDDSSKTDVRPSTPGSSSSPQPKKGRVLDVFGCSVSVIFKPSNLLDSGSETSNPNLIEWNKAVRSVTKVKDKLLLLAHVSNNTWEALLYCAVLALVCFISRHRADNRVPWSDRVLGSSYRKVIKAERCRREILVLIRMPVNQTQCKVITVIMWC